MGQCPSCFQVALDEKAPAVSQVRPDKRTVLEHFCTFLSSGKGGETGADRFSLLNPTILDDVDTVG